MKLEYEVINSLSLGVEYTKADEDKIIFSRFTEQERDSLTYGKDDSRTTAGVKIEFKTDSDYIRIMTKVKASNPHERNFYSFDVYCNGCMVGQIKNFNKEPRYPYKNYNLADRQKTFKQKSGIKHICIYFPWSVRGMIRKIELQDGAAVIPIQKKRTIIMYGDSITQGYDAAKPSLSYASILADKLNANVINKGIGGSAFMPELTKYRAGILPDFITVAYGTNDWRGSEFKDFNNRCCAFFENLTNNYPNTPILAIAPIWRADLNENHQLGSFSVIAKTLKQIANCHKNIRYINGIDFIPKATAYYRDGYLHPNDEGFKLYFDALIKELKKVLI